MLSLGVWHVVIGIIIFGAILRLAASRGRFARDKHLARTINVIPTGEYAQIDIRLAAKTIKILERGTSEDRQKAIERIQAHPENYAPTVFYALSQALFESGRKDDGAFWFYAGQLRARFDANRCADASATGAVEVLNERYGRPINLYAFRDIAKLEALIPQVVEWDRETPHLYDHRWINLQGMGAIMSGLSFPETQQPLSLPKDQWQAIAETTRTTYLEDFRNLMSGLDDAGRTTR